MPSISYQLYSSRNWEVEETFKMLAELGVKEVEGVGPYYEDLTRTKALLETHGMTMPTGHFAPDLVENEPEKAIEIAKTLGIQAVIVPFIPPAERPTTLAGWQEFAARLAKAGEPITAAGLQFGWHNHDFEFVAVDGQMPLDIIAEASDDIMLELDLAWVKVAGHDPAEWLAKYADRITTVHVKDRAPEGENADEGGWADVGHGIMDWSAIHAALGEAGIGHYVVEHDNPKDDARFAKRSLATLNAL